MGILAFRLFYGLWFGLVLLLTLSAISRLLFKRGDNGVKQFIDDIVFALLLPVMIFSKEGVSRLIKQIREYI